MPPKRTLAFAPADPDAFYDRYLIADADEPELTLGELLREHPALCLQELEPTYLKLKLRRLIIRVERPVADTPLYLPPGLTLPDLAAGAAAGGTAADGQPADAADVSGASAGTGPTASGGPAGSADSRHPSQVSDRQAVLVAHAADIASAASYLDGGLSVLIRCEKLLVEHLAEEIAARSGRTARVRSGRPRQAIPAAPGSWGSAAAAGPT